MAKLYIASSDIALGLAQHSYLVIDFNDDPNSINDQHIIRGGPTLSAPPYGDILVEANFSSLPPLQSADSLDIDADSQRDLDPFLDRNYTELILPNGLNASLAWDQLKIQAQKMGTINNQALYDTGIQYLPGFIDSNSVVNSLLSSIGVDFREQTPFVEGNVNNTRLPPNSFGFGHLSIIDSASDDSFTAFAFNNSAYTFYDHIGSDTITVERGARLEIITDGVPASGNNVNLVDQNADKLTLDKDALSNDLTIQLGGFTLSPLVNVDDHFGAGGLGINVLAVQSVNLDVVHSINLAAAIPNTDFDFFLGFRNTYTVMDGETSVTGDSTNDRLYGLDSQGDTLTGGFGNDVLQGGLGNDIYAWNIGDGDDHILDTGSSGLGDTLLLGLGITSSMVQSCLTY